VTVVVAAPTAVPLIKVTGAAELDVAGRALEVAEVLCPETPKAAARQRAQAMARRAMISWVVERS
jgi:hypothetical protein